MSSKPRLQVGVVGAGIAGLAAAIALRRANCDVEVFERSSFRNEIGAAVTISPNSARVLDYWGFDSAKARATENLQLRIKVGATLDHMYRDVYGSMEEKYGHKNWSFHRVDLHEGLIKLATDVDVSKGRPAKIRLATEVTDIDCEKGEMTTANGEKVRKDLVIVADGAHVSQRTFCLQRLS
jgi:salicylate hydroxylase